MIGYLAVRHPVTAEPIDVVPTGNTANGEAEGLVISPKAGMDRIWFKKADIITS